MACAFFRGVSFHLIHLPLLAVDAVTSMPLPGCPIHPSGMRRESFRLRSCGRLWTAPQGLPAVFPMMARCLPEGYAQTSTRRYMWMKSAFCRVGPRVQRVESVLLRVFLWGKTAK